MPGTVSFALASIGLSTAVFFLFCLGWAKCPAFFLVALLLPWIPRRRPSLPPLWTLPVLVPFTLLYLWHALSPEVQPDSLHYHLMLARQAQTTGAFPSGISFYNLIPQGMEALFAMAYGLAGERGAKLLHLAYLLASVPLLLAIARKLDIDSNAAWAAALFYYVTPVTGITATCTYNDAALAFFTLATFLLLLEDRPWLAGLTAGFCYAIKMPGAMIVAAGFVWYFWRRRPWEAARFSIAAAAVMAPWLLRNAILTGNPFAPMLNAVFPNPAFHIDSERELAQWLRDYGGVAWSAIPIELTLRGGTLQGLLGPAWVAAGIAVVLLRGNPLLLIAAAIAALPFGLNIGTRFLIPALPFLSLAAFQHLPRTAALLLLGLHAILSLPPVVKLYAAPNAWTLHVPPAQRTELHDLAAFVEQKTPREARILDLANAPAAITPRHLVSAWQSAAGDRMVRGLRFASGNDATLYRTCATFPERPLRGLRIEFPSNLPRSLAIHNISLANAAGAAVKPTALWALSADPNPWESPLAADGNPVSAWSTWQPVQAGMHWEADFAIAQPIAQACVWLAEPYAVSLQGLDATWQPLPATAPERQPALNYRRAAIRYLQREGITHILAAETADAFGEIAIDMAKRPSDWSLTPAGTVGNTSLFRLP